MDPAKIPPLSQAGISVCRVIKLSKIAAVMTIGEIPNMIFNPSSAPIYPLPGQLRQPK